MNKIVFRLSMMVLVMSVVINCSNPIPAIKYGPYNNTLRFYDGGYPMTKMSVSNFYRSSWESTTGGKPIAYPYIEYQGILSNTNYVVLLDKTNLANIKYDGAIWITNYLTNTNYSIFHDNGYSRVIDHTTGETNAFLIDASTKNMVIFNTDSQIKIYSISNMSLLYHNTNSEMHKYGPTRKFACSVALLAHNKPVVAYVTSDFKLYLLHFTNSNSILIGDGFSVGAFSTDDKYLFYTDFGRKDDYSSGYPVSHWYHLYHNHYVKNCGQPYICDITTGSNYAIATYTCIDTQDNFSNNVNLGVMDGFYAIEYSLSNLYIYADVPDYSYAWGGLIGEDDSGDVYGLYKIDISSLGLTE